MTTPQPAAAAPAAPAPDVTGALWRAFCALAVSIDARADPGADPGAAVNVALTHGTDPADAAAVYAWAAARTAPATP